MPDNNITNTAPPSSAPLVEPPSGVLIYPEALVVGVLATLAAFIRKNWKEAYGLSAEIYRNHNQSVKFNAELAYLGGVLDADRVVFFGFKNSEYFVDGSHVFKLSVRADWNRRGLAGAHEAFSFLLNEAAFSRLVGSPLLSQTEPWVGTSASQKLEWVDDGAGLGCSVWGVVKSDNKLKGLLMAGWSDGHKACYSGQTILPPGQLEEFERVRGNLFNF